MIYRTFITADGTFGDATSGFAIVNTTNISSEEMENLCNASDSSRYDLFLAKRDLEAQQAGLDPETECDWEDLEDTIFNLRQLLQSQYQDDEMRTALVLINRIARAVGF